MDEDLDHDGGGRAWLIFVAVILMTAAAGAAAWFTMGDGSSRASGTPETAVLGKRTTASTTTAAPATTSTTTPAPTSTAPTTTTTAPITPTGRFLAAGGTSEVRGTGTVHTYSVEAEEGSGVHPDELAAIVDVILLDQRGWTAKGYAFQRVPSGGSFTISLATPDTTDAICAPLDTAGRFSCHEGHRVVLNLTRWNEGTTDLALDLNGYRAEVVNHEVGHELGLDHVGCGGAGLHAPVMMQQSKGLDGCAANPWPALDGTPAG
ncbi:MAG TPA: DUF3152 domain-containing protein [Acidimicrobiales bacterium]|nr:DUF3152 domain-containing protein [Acidimicrobiales bacterium]